MEENNKQGFTIHITDSTVQLNPNATTAVQNFYGNEFAENVQSFNSPLATSNEDEQRLAVYLKDEDTFLRYKTQLTKCHSAKEVGKVVLTMRLEEPGVDKETAVSAKFIEALLPLIPNVKRGRGIDNLRCYINKAWDDRRKK